MRGARGLALWASALLLASPLAAQELPDPADVLMASYSVSGGALRLSPSARGLSGGESRSCLAIARYVWAALPDDAASLVSRIVLFKASSDAGDDSDGMASESEDGEGWTLSLDYGEGFRAVVERRGPDESIFDEVVAHEIAHVLSLNESQAAEGDSPETYADEVGPFKADSYLNRFYQLFWKGRYPEWKADDDDAAALAFERHPGSFVTAYAAADPSEDFAESFAYFVLSDKPAGDREDDGKLRFFYGIPQLLRDREQLRGRLLSAK